jgi:hypothetical protein
MNIPAPIPEKYRAGNPGMSGISLRCGWRFVSFIYISYRFPEQQVSTQRGCGKHLLSIRTPLRVSGSSMLGGGESFFFWLERVGHTSTVFADDTV